MKIASNIISHILISILLIAVVGFGLSRIMGYKMFSVLTGSMTPAYNVGDLLFVKPTAFEDINKGDTITFMVNAKGTVVTHRVIEKDVETRSFKTKGDANDTEDINPTVYENVVGVVKYSIPNLGKVIDPLNSTRGKIFTVAGVLVGLILMHLIPLIFKKEEVEEK